MRLFSKILLVLSAAAGLALSGCNVPEAVPTATSTPEVTPTAVPTVTRTPRPTPTETPVPEYLTVDPSEYNGVTLILRYRLDGTAREKLEELAQQFNKENEDGIILQLEPSSSQEAFLSATKEQGSAQLLIAGSAYLRELEGNGLTMTNLADFMNTTGLLPDADPIMSVMLAQEDQNGIYSALPLWAEPGFLFYNKTWAIELGYPDTPLDLAAFAEQACAAGRANYTDEDDGKHGTGGWIVSSDTEDVMSWLLNFAQDSQTAADLMSDDTGSVFTDTAGWLRNLYDNGCAWNSRVNEPYDYFANRYALFYSGTYSDAERQLSAFEQSESFSFDNWDLITYPVRTGDGQNDPRIYAEIISIAIPQGEAKETGAAWQFIRWLYQGTNAAELALSANGWAVQDSNEITRLYRNSGKDKLYQTLSWRQYLVPNNAGGEWLTNRMILSDGFAYVFNIAATADDIPGIWEQIGTAIAEINSVKSVSEDPVTENTVETGGIDENEP